MPGRLRRTAVALTASLLGALLIPVASAANANANAQVGVQARPADSFVGSIGVATHFNYAGEYENKAMIEQRLVESGIRRVRASWSPDDLVNQDLAVRLGKRGMKIMFWTGQVGSDLARVKQAIKQTNALAPGTIDAIEGPNEQDNHPGLRAFVQQYHDVLKADPATAQLRIYGPSMANVGSSTPYTSLGDISQWVDAANVHNYPGGRMMSDAYIDSMYDFTRRNVGATGALMASELGYSNATGAADQPHPAVPQAASAVLIPRLYLEHFRRGLTETYVYELINEAGQTPWEAEFGLLNSDFSPKPAFTAIKNMNTLLADPGPTFTPGTLNYTLTGTDTATRQLLLQKRDGSYWLALWQQNEIWDRVTKQWTNIKDIPVTLNLPTTAQVTTYRPVTSTAPITTTTSTTTTINSGVSPTLVKISPSTSDTTTPSPAPTTAPLPTTPPVPTAPAVWTKRINSGGGTVTDAQGQVWSADTDFAGGSTYTAPTAGLSPLSTTSRFGAYSYNVPVPASGDYKVRIHSTETYWNAPTQRVFSAQAEGQTFVRDLDLVAAAGKNQTVTRETTVRVTDGALTLNLNSLVNYATLDAVEVTAVPAPSAAPLPTTPPVPTAPAVWTKRINSGGGTVTDAQGQVWSADTDFAGGSTYTAPTAGLSPLSTTSRFGAYSYNVPVPASGDYKVRIHSTETYWNAPTQRVFSAQAEGQTFVRDLDLVAAAGKNQTVTRETTVRVTDGALTLNLDSLVNYATLDAVEVTAVTKPWALRVNAGGPAVIDSAGRTWDADRDYDGGSSYRSTLEPSSVVSADSRFGSLNYDFAVPGEGTYLVKVHTTETYWSASNERVFSMSAEGSPLVRDLDLVATVGRGKTHVVEAPVLVTDGKLTLSLASHVNYATVDGIEIIRQP